MGRWWEFLSGEDFENYPATKEDALEMILYYERLIDEEFEASKITQEEAWDRYFCPLHACDEWHLSNHRVRILAKIDTKTYNPLQSNNPDVIFIARLRLRGAQNPS